MSSSLRLIRLLVTARLRSAGWAPWLLAMGWLLVAALQEPLLFRNYGIYLVQDAAWVAGLAVMLVLLLTHDRQPRRCAVRTNLCILGGIACLQATAGYLVDQSPTRSWTSARFLEMAWFLMAWAPLSITLSRKAGNGGMSRMLHMMVVLAAAITGSMQAVALRQSPDTLVLSASVLAFGGAAGWASDPRKQL